MTDGPDVESLGAIVWYFAYGSNMETATFSGRRGIAYRRAVPARIPGWRLVLDKPGIVPVGHGFANIVPDDAAAVLGVLYEIRTVELDHLDLSEGVLIGNYRRVEVVAETLTSRATKVGAQTFASDRRDVSLRPSTRYLACLIAGAREHGLPAAYVEWLRAVPACEESAETVAFRPLLDDALRRRR